MIKQHARNLFWSLYKKQFTIFWNPLQYAVVGFPRVDNEAAPLRGGQVFSYLHCTACLLAGWVDARSSPDSPHVNGLHSIIFSRPLAFETSLLQHKDRAETRWGKMQRGCTSCFGDCVYTLAVTMSMTSRSFEEIRVTVRPLEPPLFAPASPWPSHVVQ